MYIENMPKYFRYAVDNIPCDCDLCKCPAVRRKNGKYSFVYINEELKVIYFNVPKAASSTVRRCLFNCDNDFSMVDPKKDVSDYFSFTIVRNPWDRMVSLWKMFTTVGFRIEQMRSMYDNKIKDFRHFLQITSKINNHHWQPQILFLPEKCTFIGKTENLQNDMDIVYDKLGLKRIKIPRANTTNHSHYSKYYDDEARQFVAERYKEDISIFDYKFEKII